MRKWQFGQMWDQRWYWRRLHDDGSFLESTRAFDSKIECVADAFDHGYCSPPVDQSIFLPRDVPPSLPTADPGY
jgi:hypothetical protein